MTALLHFEEKVHYKGPGSGRSFSPIDVEVSEPGLRASGFLEEPRIERGVSYPKVLSIERSLYMHLHSSTAAAGGRR